jgi:hypothetical protein
MTDTFTVTGVTRALVGGTDCWFIHQLRPDGQAHLHVLPVDTLAWRAAEYGIDPADLDTLLDVVLHEPHMPDDGRPQSTPASRDAARADLLQRIADTKANRVRIVSPPRRGPSGAPSADPLDLIRHHTINPDRARAIHDHVNGQGHAALPHRTSKAAR